jgi:hypothetical protein
LADGTFVAYAWDYACLAAGVIILSALLAHTILFWQHAAQLPTPVLRQTYGCDWRLADGHWSTYGAPASRKWMTDGCFSHAYQSQDVEACLLGEPTGVDAAPGNLERRRLVFLGDSTARALFWAFARLLGMPGREADQPRHANIALRREVGQLNVSLDFYWDPTLATMPANPAFLAHKGNPLHLLVIGAGSWPLRSHSTQDAQLFAHSLSSLLRKLRPWEAAEFNATTATREPPLPITFVRFVGPVVAEKLSPERRTLGVPDLQDLYNRILLDRSTANFDAAHQDQRRLLTSTHRMLQLAPPETTQDGLHYAGHVVGQEVNLMLNSMCNQRLFASPASTDQATCCVTKETLLPPVRTLLFFVVLSVCGPVAYGLHALGRAGGGFVLPFPPGSLC